MEKQRVDADQHADHGGKHEHDPDTWRLEQRSSV